MFISLTDISKVQPLLLFPFGFSETAFFAAECIYCFCSNHPNSCWNTTLALEVLSITLADLAGSLSGLLRVGQDRSDSLILC